jgi:hypothetical protein
MRSTFRSVITLTVLTVGTPLFNMAQDGASSQASQQQRAKLDPPSAADKPSVPSEPQAATAAELKPTVEQEIEALKSRISELENEVRQSHAERPVDSNDAAMLNAAAKELVAGSATPGISHGSASAQSGSSTTSTTGPPVTQITATATGPEISAQRTTKGEPFPGDWTWLNSNGHASDSPMATKYFTPEFRADAHYMLDYNHPKDDTMGGCVST